MAGFLQRVSRAGETEFVEGLPVKLLPVALVFRNHVENLSTEVRRRADFPSWSWAGWRAPSFWDIWKQFDIIEGEDQIIDWLVHANWITWRILKRGEVPAIIHDPISAKQTFSTEAGLWRSKLT